MSDTFWSSFFASIPALVTALGAIWLGMRATNRKIDKVQEATNGKMEQLIKTDGEAKHAAGMLAGVAQEKAEQAVKALVKLEETNMRAADPYQGTDNTPR